MLYVRKRENDGYSGLGYIKLSSIEATAKLAAIGEYNSNEIGGFNFQQ